MPDRVGEFVQCRKVCVVKEDLARSDRDTLSDYQLRSRRTHQVQTLTQTAVRYGLCQIAHRAFIEVRGCIRHTSDTELGHLLAYRCQPVKRVAFRQPAAPAIRPS